VGSRPVQLVHTQAVVPTRALAPSQLRWRNPVALLFSSAPWASALYLVSYVVFGVAAFALTLSLVLVSGVLSIFWIGLPLLLAALAVVRTGATIERGRARLVGVHLRAGYRPSEGAGLFAALRTRLGDRARWRDLLALVALWPVLLVLNLFAFIAWLVPLTLISLPFWYRYVPNTFDNGTSAHGIVLGYLPDGPHGATRYGWFIGDIDAALVAAGVGLVLLLLVGNYLVVGAARLHVRTMTGLLDTPVRPAGTARASTANGAAAVGNSVTREWSSPARPAGPVVGV
jgi:hypothetical protein